MKGMMMLALLGLLAAGDAAAGTIDGRQHRQARRIAEGMRSGELTPRETACLTAQQAALRAEERHYRHDDGHLGPWERLDLQRDLNRTSHRIHAQRQDGQDR